MVEVNMERRKDQVKMVVLHGREAIRQKADVMIVDEGESSHHGTVGFGSGFLDQGVADQIAKRFGAVGVSALFNVLVEFGEKVGIDGYADAAEIAHLLSG